MKQEEFEYYVEKYLKKKKVARFNDLKNWLSTIMVNPPSKATLSIKLDKMAKEGKIISWNEKGARYISLPCSHEELKEKIMKIMNDLSLKRNDITIEDIMKKIKLPKGMISEAITDLVSEGKIINTIRNGITYYKLPPIHASIKIGMIFIILIGIIYLIGGKTINKDGLFFIYMAMVIIITTLWYIIR